MSNTHKLKTLVPYWYSVLDGYKTFEVRKKDRDFKVNDKLILAEWCDVYNRFTGREIEKTVSYILEGGQFGIEEGYVVMGLEQYVCIRR